MTPVTVNSGITFSSHRANRHGPFESGGNLYGVFLDTTNNHVEVWKSTDSGATWAEVDSANHKVIYTIGSTKSVDAVQVGDTLHILYANNGGAYAVAQFSMSSDTWGSVVTSGITATNANVSGTSTAFLAVRSDGDYIVLHNGATQSVMGTPYRRVVYSRYEGGTWTSNTNVDGIGSNAQHADARMIAMDASDRAYLVYTNATNGTLHVKTLTSANTLGTASSLSVGTTQAGYSYAVGHSQVVAGAQPRVVYPFAGSTSFSFRSHTLADTPTNVATTITSTVVPDYTTSNPGSVALDSTDAYVFYPDDATDDLQRSKGTQDSGTGAYTFPAPTEFQDAVTVQGVSVGKISNAIGIFYLDNGTVKYDSYSLGTPPLQAAGVLAGTSTTAGAVKVTKELAAADAGTSTTTGAAKLTEELAATVAGTSSTTGAATVARNVYAAASVAGTATATATAELTIEVAATVAGTSTTTGAITATEELAGTVAGTSTITGATALTASLAATVAGTSTVTGDAELEAGVELEIAGALAGTSTATAAIEATETLTGTSAGTSTATANATLGIELTLAGSVAGTSSTTGATALTVDMAATVAGTSTVAGAIKPTEELAGTSAGTSTVAGATTLTVDAAALSAGTSTVTGTIEETATLAGSIAGTSTVTGDATTGAELNLSGTVAGTSTVGTAFIPDVEVESIAISGNYPSSITLPAGVQVGDLLLALMRWEEDPVAVLDGFTLLDAGGSAYNWIVAQYRVADGSEGATATITPSWGTNSAIVARISAVSASDPVNVAGVPEITTGSGASSKTVVLDAISPPDPGTVLASIALANTTGAPGATTLTIEGVAFDISIIGSIYSGGATAEALAASGSTGTRTVVITKNSSYTVFGALVALNPTDVSTFAVDTILTSTVAATVAGTSAVAGVAELTETLAGSIAGTSAVTGDATLGTAVSLAGVIAGTSTVTGTAELTEEIAATSAGTSTATGTAELTETLSGTIAGTSTVTGDASLGTELTLSGSIAGTSTVTADTALLVTTQGVLTGTSAITAATILALTLTGAADGTSTLTGSLEAGTAQTLAGAIFGSSTVAGSIAVRTELAAAVAGSSSTAADIDAVIALAGAIAGTSTTTAARPDLIAALAGSIAGTSSITAIIKVLTDITMTGRLTVEQYLTATVAITAYLSGEAAVTQFLEATIETAPELSATVAHDAELSGRMEIT